MHFELQGGFFCCFKTQARLLQLQSIKQLCINKLSFDLTLQSLKHQLLENIFPTVVIGECLFEVFMSELARGS